MILKPRHPTRIADLLDRVVLLALLAGSLGLEGARACAPEFPTPLLEEAGVVTAALSRPFVAGVLGLSGVPRPTFPHRGSDTPETAIEDAEIQALRRTLSAAGTSDPELERQLETARATIRGHRSALRSWREAQVWSSEPLPRPTLGAVEVPARLPAELRLYLEGAVAYHQGDLETATQRWRAVLELPEVARRERSVMAAFMLGRAVLDAAPELALDDTAADAAIARFHQVRELARAGFRDDLALAHESLGWEARAEWRRGRFSPALALYAEQLAAGDALAEPSLIRTCERLTAAGREALAGVAADALAREIFTLYLSSRDGGGATGEQWLAALSEARAERLEGAGRLAWLAYQLGRFDQASRWLEAVSDDDPHNLWLRGKLLARSGALDSAQPAFDAAARRLAELVPADRQDPATWVAERSAARSRAEAGALALGRGDYPAALDALLRSGYWLDAAWVAERVLTSDELAAYVDAVWPRELADDSRWYTGLAYVSIPPEAALAWRIRHVLAKRLAREKRWHAAVPYFPGQDLRRAASEIAAWLDCDTDPACSQEQRGAALWEVAQVLRSRGMALVGSELDPDWNGLGGLFDLGGFSRSGATQEEIDRVATTRVEPHLRYHYRYLAAELAWRAAELLPDDDEQTAEVLATAGSWLKNLDPARADRFYKALVRRCGQTALGREADRLRWFPPLPTALDPRS